MNQVKGNIKINIKNAEKIKELLDKAATLSKQLTEVLIEINEMNHQVDLEFCPEKQSQEGLSKNLN